MNEVKKNINLVMEYKKIKFGVNDGEKKTCVMKPE